MFATCCIRKQERNYFQNTTATSFMQNAQYVLIPKQMEPATKNDSDI